MYIFLDLFVLFGVCVCFLMVFLCVFLDGVIVCVLQKKETRAV